METVPPIFDWDRDSIHTATYMDLMYSSNLAAMGEASVMDLMCSSNLVAIT